MSSESQEFRAALALAASHFRQHAGDTEAAAEQISAALGWSRERARWFLTVNAEKLQRMAQGQACGAGDE